MREFLDSMAAVATDGVATPSHARYNVPGYPMCKGTTYSIGSYGRGMRGFAAYTLARYYNNYGPRSVMGH